VEREEDRLLRSGAVEMPHGGAEARWKSVVAEAARRSTDAEAAHGARSWSRGDLLRCYGEMIFLVWG
jgi:hypothetical protein